MWPAPSRSLPMIFTLQPAHGAGHFIFSKLGQESLHKIATSARANRSVLKPSVCNTHPEVISCSVPMRVGFFGYRAADNVEWESDERIVLEFQVSKQGTMLVGAVRGGNERMLAENVSIRSATQRLVFRFRCRHDQCNILKIVFNMQGGNWRVTTSTSRISFRFGFAGVNNSIGLWGRKRMRHVDARTSWHLSRHRRCQGTKYLD
ncbi:hypothetical protein R3P38DRAFT_1893454 [Favolaschia claudopus]|uniref:Uncharacterized protein n=1 Tax=Favolaschia claudopus TaxID=2862362 RepID=A0AAW0A319_9AGAR